MTSTHTHTECPACEGWGFGATACGTQTWTCGQCSGTGEYVERTRVELLRAFLLNDGAYDISYR